ncbi:putative alcohol dehydrogenase AdhA [Georgfuchsia toluolica]|uniref:Alcohol dehydrogenase AdhA n=1 Tax=Georgfuchsia toluolica TaxID=424218 RepID=A0A916J299_9PROT|nr:zinc-dependent alcohol dehydrogenase family protein [Georgfuchsia toluolica]CAG4882511.1 putative alcohol dehydrogenase AdhA [Georgfuchsia toluolica]
MSHWFSMQLPAIGQPLQRVEHDALPVAGAGQVVIRVKACGVCRTDLHIVDGDLPFPAHPVVPGHEVIGTVVEVGAGVAFVKIGDRVGVPWLGWTCGSCEACLSGHENLCQQARFTGYQIAGGYAEYAIADARYVFAIPPAYTDVEAAPLLCAGLIGYRAYAMAQRELQASVRRIGLCGFGAAAHLVAQVARHQGSEVYAFTRPGDLAAQELARGLGAAWAGGSDEAAPQPLDAALIFAPVGALVPLALQAVRAAGVVVCAGIHMSDIPSFPYSLLWRERKLVSVANLTRADGDAFMKIAGKTKLDVTTKNYPLGEANRALDDLRHGRFSGAAVLLP